MTVQLSLPKMTPLHTKVISAVGLRYEALNTIANRVMMMAIIRDQPKHILQLRIVYDDLHGQKLTSRRAAQQFQQFSFHKQSSATLNSNPIFNAP
jgi:hypothetical protein